VNTEDRFGQAMIAEVEEIDVGEWNPGKIHENVPPTQVHLIFKITKLFDEGRFFVMRYKSREAVDELIQALIKHRDGVWPE
jgi:hypothetical protein